MRRRRSIVFVHLAYDRVPREELWYCMSKLGEAEKSVRVVRDMYENGEMVARCVVGVQDQSGSGITLGLSLSPSLFAVVVGDR